MQNNLINYVLETKECVQHDKREKDSRVGKTFLSLFQGITETFYHDEHMRKVQCCEKERRNVSEAKVYLHPFAPASMP